MVRFPKLSAQGQKVAKYPAFFSPWQIYRQPIRSYTCYSLESSSLTSASMIWLVLMYKWSNQNHGTKKKVRLWRMMFAKIEKNGTWNFKELVESLLKPWRLDSTSPKCFTCAVLGSEIERGRKGSSCFKSFALLWSRTAALCLAHFMDCFLNKCY